MKNVFKYLKAVLACLFVSLAFVACNEDDDLGSADLGLGIKVFSPTRVVAGQPMTINGSGFGDVTEVEFPGGVKVSIHEENIVTNEMLRLVAPAGISAEGGKIIVRNSKGEEVESRLPLTVGKTVVDGFSKQAGEKLKGLEEITIFGTDLQFIKEVELLDAEGAPLVVDAKDFTRITPNKVIVRIPNDIFTGFIIGKIRTLDGLSFDMPELEYEPTVSGGHWETTKRYLWTNDGSHGEISWNGDYRFTYTGNDGNNECIAQLAVEDWEIIKTGTFYLEAKGSDWVQMRITTGWWSTTWTGDDISTGNERIVDNGDGTYYIEINFAGDPILDVLDQQHLLFTGGGYTPQGLYVLEQEWVGGDDEGHMERKSLWKNDGSLGEINWNGDYRFSNVEHITGEQCHAFEMDEWEIIKTKTFLVEVEGANPQIRVTTGWWSTTWTGNDIQPGNELLVDNGNGTWTLTVNLSGDPILDVLDDQHLLFTGSGYKVNEIYVEEWVEGGGAGASEVLVWENDGSHGEISWNGDYRFSNVETSTGEEIYAIPMDQWEKIKSGTFYLDLSGASPQIRVTSGWWSTTWTGDDIFPGNEKLTDNGDGTWTLEVNLAGDPLLDVLDAQHLLFTGGGYTPLKLYFK